MDVVLAAQTAVCLEEVISDKCSVNTLMIIYL